MVGSGIFLVIMGLGSLLLPMFNIQFQIMSLFDEWQPFVGGFVAAVGVALIGYGVTRPREPEAPPPGEPSAG